MCQQPIFNARLSLQNKTSPQGLLQEAIMPSQSTKQWQTKTCQYNTDKNCQMLTNMNNYHHHHLTRPIFRLLLVLTWIIQKVNNRFSRNMGNAYIMDHRTDILHGCAYAYAGNCVCSDSCCDIQPWAWVVQLYCSAVPRSTQPPTLHRTVKWVSAYGLSNNSNGDDNVDGSCQFLADSQPKSIGLVWRLAAPGDHATFIKWIGWTLAITIVMTREPKTL